jgi:hypothetical protein
MISKAKRPALSDHEQRYATANKHHSEIATMTKTLAITALFLAGSVAATAALVNEPGSRATDVQTTDVSALDTRRGTREPLLTAIDADAAVGDQPRRGQRSDFELAGSLISDPTADGIRRGTR